ncbi:vacuolar protein sorting-associated protein 35 [Pelagophyceae sp. CCMP2097]|nr:vacuolar protein sorting-associated protein 35 [Pelagophyceae sp. CCMP2097]
MADVDEQVHWLAEASKKVKEQGFYMKRAMDSGDVKQALNSASDLLRELRTSLLTPRNYYELYMKVLDELHHLDDFFFQLVRDGKKAAPLKPRAQEGRNRPRKKQASELYEQVQSCGNVLPRMYLLITVGATYIKSRQAPAKDILNDLVEMAKGVQHPMRGLFLRNYLAHACRDKLPDTGSEYEGHGGDVSHAVDFVLLNFSETNRLWVRMQNQGAQKDRKRREKERQELRILVGTNLVRLSQLEGVDVQRYSESVLPRLLEQVVNCKDSIAQPYLLDCIIQVFPDEFHLATLEPFLRTCTQLREKVNVRTILESMMKRLASGARDAASEAGGTAVRAPPEAFAAFNSCAAKLVEDKAGKLELAEVLRLQAALLEFALECYAGRLDYVNHCFATCAAVLAQAKRSESGLLPLDDGEAEQLERILSAPLTAAVGQGQLLELALFGQLLAYLPWRRRHDVALAVARAVLDAGKALDSLAAVEKLFAMIGPLLKDSEDAAEAQLPQADREAEQLLVARLAHLMRHGSTDEQFRIFGVARRHFGQGGLGRIRFTLVPLVFRALQLARKVRKFELAPAPEAPAAAEPPRAPDAADDDAAEGEDVAEGDEETVVEEAPPASPASPAPPVAEKPALQYSCRKVFQFVHEIVTAMAGSFPALSLKLFLECAQCADVCGFKAISYEFVSQAFILYEDELPDSKAQLKALHSMVGTLLAARGFDDGDYDALATKTTQYCAKLLKKPDQCRMVANCSHLFWVSQKRGLDADGTPANAPFRDSRRVLECLQRSIKIADVCMTSGSQHIHLFVEILDHYVTHFERESPTVTEKYISGLVELIDAHVENMEPSDARRDVEAHYRNTLHRIRSKNIISA